MTDTCWWCADPSTRLCDAVVAVERRKSDNTILTDEMFTCDAPMCDAHALQIGHVCGQEPDSMDRCPHHAQKVTMDLRKLPTGPAEAKQKRKAIQVAALRSRIGLVR